MAQNGISTETAGDPTATKILRRTDKLALAAAKRSTPNTPGYRTLNTISGTHSAYVNGQGGAVLSTLSGTASPTEGHPWASGGGGGAFTVDWFGTTLNLTPIGTYSADGTGIRLDPGSFFDTEQTLSSSTFTVTVDANMSTGDGNYWNVMWGNDNYGGPDNGYLAYWNGGGTNLNLGDFSAPVSITTPNIMDNARRLFTFVIDGTSQSLYINGTLVGDGIGSIPTIPANTFYIGSRHNNSGGSGPSDARGGTYYSVKVEAAALTPQQVLDAYTAWGH